jgi:hypothetical protein
VIEHFAYNTTLIPLCGHFNDCKVSVIVAVDVALERITFKSSFRLSHQTAERYAVNRKLVDSTVFPTYLRHFYDGGKFKHTGLMFEFLVAFTKLRKETVSFIMFVRPSVRMEQLSSHWTGFDEI